MSNFNIVCMYSGVEKSNIYGIAHLPEWAQNSLNITHKHNSDAIVTLLSNTGFKSNDIMCCDYNEFISNDLREFSENYEHMSTNHVHMELFCFVRWFILRNFMVKNKINRLLFLDIDVVCIDNLREDFNKLRDHDATLSRGSSPHTNFIKIECLVQYCNFIHEIYTNKSCKYWTNMQNTFAAMKYGGICDMTLWNWFSSIYEGDILKNIQDYHPGFDHAIRDIKDWSSEQIEWSDSNTAIKKFAVNNSVVSCFNQQLKQQITFKTIHFQGGPAKNWLNSGSKLYEKILNI